MRKFTIVTLFLGLFAVGGCATTPKMCTTPSGKPEVTIHTADVGQIKSEIISTLMNDGYSIDKDTNYLLELSRPANDREDFSAALSIGNSYSTNYRVASFSFANINNGIRVVASLSLRAQMPGGQVNSLELHNNGDIFNLYQKTLLDIKSKIESSNSPSPPAH